jgi:lambda repressor-like predicted transcriptional regulator
MDTRAEPPITPEIREGIAGKQYDVHKKFWPQIQELQTSSLLATSNLFAEIGGGPRTKKPPMPRQPIRLFRVLTSYAQELFNCEDVHYRSLADGADELAMWRSALVPKIEQLVMDNVNQIETPLAPLAFHATHDSMRANIREGLHAHIEQLRRTFTMPPPKPLTASALAISSSPQRGPKPPSSQAPARQIIDAFCDKHGWSLDQLADKAGVDRRQVFRVRRGKRIRRFALVAIAGVLGVEPNSLMP